MSDDDDDVAIDGGQEEAVSMEQFASGVTPGGAGSDDDDESAGDGDDPSVLPAGSVSLTSTPRGTRPISSKVRDMLRAIGLKNKAQPGEVEVEEGEDVAITGDIEEPYGKKAAPAGKVATEAAPQPAAGQAPSVPPPAASLDPEVVKARETWAAKVAELDAREKGIADRDRASDMDAYREQYTEKGAPAVVRFIKSLTGLDGDALKEELADLVTDLSASELGVDIPETIRQRLDTKRASRSIKAMKDGLVKQKADEETKAGAKAESERRNYAIHVLNQEIKKPDQTKLYPLLALDETPGLLIATVYERQNPQGDRTDYTWQDAAKEVNANLLKHAIEVSAYVDARRHLLPAVPGTGGQQQQVRTATRETAQGQRRSQPTQTPQEPPVIPVVKNGRYDPDAHRRQTKDNPKIRALFQTRSDE